MPPRAIFSRVKATASGPEPPRRNDHKGTENPVPGTGELGAAQPAILESRKSCRRRCARPPRFPGWGRRRPPSSLPERCKWLSTFNESDVSHDLLKGLAEGQQQAGETRQAPSLRGGSRCRRKRASSPGSGKRSGAGAVAGSHLPRRCSVSSRSGHSSRFIDLTGMLQLHDGRDGRDFKGLMGHDMAPVAGGVADAQKDGLVFPAGSLQGLRPPGVPIHRIVGMLLEIGAGERIRWLGRGSGMTGSLGGWLAPTNIMLASEELEYRPRRLQGVPAGVPGSA